MPPGKKSRLEWRLVRPVFIGPRLAHRIAGSPGLRLIQANDRDALSIEQCVFFDQLISFAYKFRTLEARHGNGRDTAAVARLCRRAGGRELLGSRQGHAPVAGGALWPDQGA